MKTYRTVQVRLVPQTVVVEVEDKMDGQPELVRRRFSGQEEWRYFTIENWNNDRKTDPNEIHKL